MGKDKEHRKLVVKKGKHSRKSIVMPRRATHNKGSIQRANGQHHTKLRENQSDPTEIKNKTRLSTLSISIQFSA